MMMTNTIHDRYTRAFALKGDGQATARSRGERRAAAAGMSLAGRFVFKPAPRCAAKLEGAPVGGRLNRQILDNQV